MIKVEEFIKESKNLGYNISGSVFKVDYNGKIYTVGFWIRAAKWNSKKQEYELPGRIGKAKDSNLEKAVELAIKEALKHDK